MHRKFSFFMEMLLIVVGTLTLVSTATELTFRWLAPPDEITLESRITDLSQSLQDATDVITEIQREVNKRMTLVSELEQKARVAEQLYNTNREQVEAVALLLRSELDKNETRSFWINVAQNTIFMLVGAFVGYFVERWMSRRRAREAEAV